jgi:non-lysosomal glucosylceramidase
MDRRKFIKSTGAGVAATSVAPWLTLAPPRPGASGQAKPAAPHTETYAAGQRPRSGIAHGGIGAGSIELRKDGNFYNWSIFNNYPLGNGPVLQPATFPHSHAEDSYLFFIVRFQEAGQAPAFKLLQLNNSLDEGAMQGIAYYFPWMSAAAQIEYQARFPFTQLRFTDPDMPFEVEMEAFSPFIPHDVKNSALPGVYFNFRLIPKLGKRVEVMLMATLRNLVGYDLKEKYFRSKLVEGRGYKYCDHSAGGMDTAHTSFGQMGLASLADDSSYYLGWEHKHPFYERLLVENRLANLDDTDNRNITVPGTERRRGRFTSSAEKDQRCFSSLAITRELDGQQPIEHTFALAWHFPNHYGSYSVKPGDFEGDYRIAQQITKRQGHYYENHFADAAEVAKYLAENRGDLEKRSREFLGHFFDSSLPAFALDQVNSQLNTFISSSVLRKDGGFGIREGLTPDRSWGPNATMDVSLYGSPMIVALFPELQKQMMRQHQALQTDKGEVNHGLALDLDYTLNGTWGVNHRIDLAPNYIQMVLRDCFFTNDAAYLQEMWPSVKKAIVYVLQERSKNGGALPWMEGIMCSYDNFPMYGHAAYLLSQWASAMGMAAEAAKDLGDAAFESQCRAIGQQAVQAMEENLWNGSYYRLYNELGGPKGKDEGCLTDQLIGQWTAHLCGLGHLFRPERVRQALSEIVRRSFNGQFLRNCSWPQHPEFFPVHETDWWVDQANTPWTGVELAFASLLLYEGLYDEAMRIIEAVDTRYRKAGLYWDHQEFGGHYYRPMSAWAILQGALGLSIRQGCISFDPQVPGEACRLFFAGPEGSAHFERQRNADQIIVRTGQLRFERLRIGRERLTADRVQAYRDGQPLSPQAALEEGKLMLSFGAVVALKAGEVLEVRYAV